MNIPLLSPAYFTGELYIAGLNGSTDAAIANAYDLQWFINEYEEEYLRRLLGDDTYDEFAAGIIAGTSKWIALKEKIYTSKTYNQETPAAYNDITDDETFADAVAAGYLLEYVVFVNSTIYPAVLSMGTTAGGYDVFQSMGIQASGLTTIPVGKVLSLTDAVSLYLNHSQTGDEFNGASLSMYLILSPVSVSSPAPSSVPVLQLFSPAANFVYFFFQQNAVTATGLNGESQPNQENSNVVLNSRKMIRAWNKMVYKSKEIRQWIEDNSTTYPDYTPVTEDFLTPLNDYGA